MGLPYMPSEIWEIVF